MDVFELRGNVVEEYGRYVRSFIKIRDPRIDALVKDEFDRGLLWPEPLVQLNPSFEPGESLDSLVRRGVLHPSCGDVFRDKPSAGTDRGPLQFHHHQVEAIEAARAGKNYVLTTGTGSGKSLSYIVPIVDHVLRNGSGRGIQAIVVYPMNALANSQLGELKKFLCHGFPEGQPPVRFARYTGQETEDDRADIIQRPPDILLTNYVMLELILTRPKEAGLVTAAKGLRFLAFDELHTYRGRQGADVALLIRRLRERCEAHDLLHIGTSATMAGGATWGTQQREVADIATKLFGAPVEPQGVIGETLRRGTRPTDLGDPVFVEALRARVLGAPCPADATGFAQDPLASWIESTLGICPDSDTGRLVRSKPRAVPGDEGVAAELAKAVGADRETCAAAIRETLMAGYRVVDANRRPVFAFRLHQFISKGESVYASPESEEARHVTLQRQKFVPNSDRERVLLPLVFCRECGQEYYVVFKTRPSKDGPSRLTLRDLGDHDQQEGEPGFLCIDTRDPWPDTPENGLIGRLPDSWLEDGPNGPEIRRARRDRLPAPVWLSADATVGGGTIKGHWIDAPFLFCMHCRVDYSAHTRDDFSKLATLGSEGRSTATTVLTLSTIRRLRRDATLPAVARKLLSFTDNRQDASLQAGHFNDFVQVVLLRAALWQAVVTAGASGIFHEDLTRRVFDALALPPELYGQEPHALFAQADEQERALRKVIGYYVYRDLERGWRLTSPNLEQCGLLRIEYRSLDRLAKSEEHWSGLHPALASASAEVRERVAKVLLDHLRRELAIRVDYLDRQEQESILQLSRQHLTGSWSLEDEERLEQSAILLPRSQRENERAGRFVYLSARGGFGLFLKRQGTFPGYGGNVSIDDGAVIIRDLLRVLTTASIVREVLAPRNAEDVPGYQLNASVIVWKAGDAEAAFHDPVRVPNAPTGGLRANPFFVDFYRADLADIRDLEGREHTAQVPNTLRQEREDRFKEAKLPLLFCSPTMELGVDIAQLNVVNMRNVPPTPANYAQRSGRAGRSGQPAFVFAYCSVGSPHDQYFFRRPQRMVAGAVTTPRLDLSNGDLLAAHVRAIWLSAANLDLRRSLSDLLDVQGETPTLQPLENVQAALDDLRARDAAFVIARAALGSAVAQYVGEEHADAWIRRVLAEVPAKFNSACRRWRDLYQAAMAQSQRQSAVVRDASRDPRDRDQAKRLRAEAEAQLNLLVQTDSEFLSDFYSYRYFAAEGFLPGYNFPRLPLSAYLPGRRKAGQDDYLSRPRFLAISEFGPNSLIYHEGHKYVVNKAILPVSADGGTMTQAATRCGACGSIHPHGDGTGPDLCEDCGAPSSQLETFDNLFTMQNVSARRRDRITSDEEERQRQGYELRTGVRFARREGAVSVQSAELLSTTGEVLATLRYGDSATLWRINLGWRRRKNKSVFGFDLDSERGYWGKPPGAADGQTEAHAPRMMTVVPFVADNRNALVITPAFALTKPEMASLQAGIKGAIQELFQLEDSEVAAEPLPDDSNRQRLLFFEAAEGGAGVLRRLVDDPTALALVAERALRRAHFDPADNMRDLRGPVNRREDCEAACYDCLMSYYNQRDHDGLDRQLLPELLRPWLDARVRTSPTAEPRDEHLRRLLTQAESDLERRWLQTADQLGVRLPESAQRHLPEVDARPDFLYGNACIFVDGPHHDEPRQRTRDADLDERLEDLGRIPIRFRYDADWTAIFRRYPSVFGPLSEAGTQADR
jgi:hypothetical protein